MRRGPAPRCGGEGSGHDPETEQVRRQPEGGDQPLAGQGADHGQGDPADEDGKGRLGGPLRSRRDPGAQHRRPQRHQGPDDGQAHPAEHVDRRVGQHDLHVQRVADAPGHQHPQVRAEREQAGGGHVVAHRGAEPGRQRPAHLADQRGPVPPGGTGDAGGPDGSDRPDVAEDAGHHECHAAVEQQHPGRPLAGVTGQRLGVQQGIGEVLAPHEDRVADRAEQQQVDHQPARRRHERVCEHHRHEEQQPEHRGQVAQRGEATLPAHRGPPSARRRPTAQAAVARKPSRATMLSTPPACQASGWPSASPTQRRSASEACSSASGPSSAGW